MTDMTLVIGVIYRAPASPVDYLQKIDEQLSTLTNSRSRIILIGDFNLPGVDWDARVRGSMERSHADSMLEIMTKYGRIQTVKKPTRTQGNCNSLLDLVFLSGEAFDSKIDIHEGISDHNSVLATINVNKCASKQKVVHIYNFNAPDDTSVIDYLESAFDTMPQDDSVENLWEYFVSTVRNCLKQFVPLKKKAVSKRKPVDYSKYHPFKATSPTCS